MKMKCPSGYVSSGYECIPIPKINGTSVSTRYCDCSCWNNLEPDQSLVWVATDGQCCEQFNTFACIGDCCSGTPSFCDENPKDPKCITKYPGEIPIIR